MGAGVACGIFSDLKEAVANMVHIGRTYQPRENYRNVYAEKYQAYEKALQAVDLLAEKLGGE
jgi:L-xylulokinase